MRALAWLGAIALVGISPTGALAECGAFWASAALVVTSGGDKVNVQATAASGGVVITPIDPGLPARLPVDVLRRALIDARLVTVQAAAIRINAPLDYSTAGARRRLNLSTDLGAGAIGPIVLTERINMGRTDRLYLRGGAIDQCLSDNSNDVSLRGGHLDINAYLGGVGQNSAPKQQLLVADLHGFSLYTEGGAAATIVSFGSFPLEEFDRGQPQGQDAIFVNGPLHIQRNP